MSDDQTKYKNQHFGGGATIRRRGEDYFFAQCFVSPIYLRYIKGAQVFVYPSIFEGFGIPIVEALESSVPVIAATGSCLSEAGGPGSIYVNPSDEGELAEQLKRVLTDGELRTRMIASGKKYIEQFEPKDDCREVVEHISKIELAAQFTNW